MNLVRTSSTLLLCAACTTTAPPEERPPLPFHVALAPITLADAHADLRPGTAGDSTDMRLGLDARLQAGLTRAIAGALRERAFAAVTLLDPPNGVTPTPETVARRDAELVRAARERGADLLLCLDLELQPVIRQEKNKVFWVNFPLFLIGGPFCWWLSDRSYFVDAEVTAWFYDPRSLASGAADAALRTTREVASARRRAERLDLDFIDRAQGDAGDFLLSMVWPCGFLAVESDDLERELSDRVVEQIGHGLARSVLDQSAELERGGPPFFLDLAQSGFVRNAAGELVLRGTVKLRPNREIETLGTWRVRAGEGPVRSRSFAAGSPPRAEGADLVYTLEEPLDAVQGATHVRLEIEAGERSPQVRSYTFRLPEGTSRP